MRFHVGFSFRLKNIKKFLFPFLIGILSYFGFSYFNLLVVNAVANVNLDTYYIFDVPDMDYENYETHGHKIIDLVDEFKGYNEYYNIVANISVNRSTLSPSLNISIIPKNITYGDYRIYIQNGNSFGDIYFSFSITENFHYYTLSATGTDSTFNTTYNYIKSCLQNNSCTGSTYSSYYTSAVGRPKADNNSDYDLTINSNVFQFVFYSDIEIKYSLPTSTSSSLYYKALNYFGENKQPGDTISSYLDILYPPDEEVVPVQLNRLDDIFLSNIDKNDLSNLTITWKFNFVSLDFANSLSWSSYFYGRKDNGTYYSYENISCVPGWNSNDSYIDENTYTYFRKISYINCSSDLTDYDSILVRFRLSSVNDFTSLISNITLSTSSGYINMSPVYNGGNFVQYMDHFSNLSPNFNLVVSTNSRLRYMNYISDNDKVLMAKVDRLTHKVNDFSPNVNLEYGNYDNTDVVLYNFTPDNNGYTDNLYVFFGDNTIISLVDESDNSYSYYFNGTINNGVLINPYTIIINDLDVNEFLDSITDYLESIQQDIYDLHFLIDEIYNGLPSSFTLVFEMFYRIVLLYVLYKEMNR